MKKKSFKFIFRFLTVNAIFYLIASFVLINWPKPIIESTENYDFSSVRKSASAEGLSKEISIPLRDGKQLFSRMYASDSDRVLIFLHGSGTDSRYLSQASHYFANSNLCTVITPDLRGHGRSAFGNKGDVAYMGQLEDDIEDVICYVEKSYRPKTILLAGDSSGGGLALRYVSNKKVTPVDGALLFSPYLGYKSPTIKPGNGNWVTVSIKRWVGLSMLSNIGIEQFNGKRVLFFNRAQKWNDSLQVADYSYRMVNSMDPRDYQEDIENISSPTLVMIGRKDESFFADKFKEVFAVSKYATTNIVEEAAHLNVVDHPKTLKTIENWLVDLQSRQAMANN